jgi:signal transduction histidine kinase
MLAALSMNLEPIQQESTKLGPKMERALSESIDLVAELSQELRTISHLLHPPMLDEAGLESALQWYVEGFAARAKFEMAPDLGRLPRELETTVFRIVQEALTNIHRHSGSPTASIRLARTPDSITLDVSDRGKGMGDGRGGPLRAGVGIQGMRERVRQLGGHLEVRSGPTGTSILATLPLENKLVGDRNKAVRAPA